MWIYQKRLQYPIKIKSSNPALAKIIASQYGGPHGEIGASLRYLSQRYVMPYPELKAILTDVGTEELAHMEMVGTIVYQLTRNLTPEQIKAAGYDAYFVDHTTGIYPVDASGNPFSALALDSTGDTLADIHEDLAAEQKARMTYDNILRFCTDEPEVRDVIRFLRAREVVHYQRFGEGLRIITDNLNDRNFYAYNPAFDRGGGNVLGSRAQKVNSRVSGQTAPKTGMAGTQSNANAGTAGTQSNANAGTAGAQSNANAGTAGAQSNANAGTAGTQSNANAGTAGTQSNANAGTAGTQSNANAGTAGTQSNANAGTAGTQSNAARWTRPNTGTAGTQSNANAGTAGTQSNAARWTRPNTGTAGAQSNANAGTAGQTAPKTGTAGTQSNPCNCGQSGNTGAAAQPSGSSPSGSKPKSNTPYYMWKFQ